MPLSDVGSAPVQVKEPIDSPVIKPLRLPHVRSLDGLRGLASIAVLMHHCLFTDVPIFVFPVATRLVEAFSSYLYLGVDLFFTLSGYLITSLLLLDRRDPDYYRNFYWKRFFRIIPALVLVLLLTHALGWTPWIGVLLALLFVANFMNFWGKPEIGPFWSLAIEEQFYLVWPMVVRKGRPRKMVRVLLAVMIVPAVLRVISWLLHHGRQHYTFVHCDGLAWGALLAVMCFSARIPWRSYNNLRLWRKVGAWMFWAGALGMLGEVFLVLNSRIDYGLSLTAAAPLFTGVLAYLITHPKAGISRFLASRPLRFLGDVSYMVYLSHTYFLEFYDAHSRGWWAHPTTGGLYLRFFVVLAITLLWSALSLYLYERPIGRLRRTFITRP